MTRIDFNRLRAALRAFPGKDRVRRILIAGVGGTAMVALGVAGGIAADPRTQDDIESVLAKGEAASQAQQASVETWLKGVGDRGDAYSEVAQHISDNNNVQLRRGMALSDDPAVRAGADAFAGDVGGQGDKGTFYVAVSLSMPPATLREVTREANAAGGRVVIRGLIGGSFKTTFLAIRKIYDEKSPAGLAIDPQVFRAFDVTAAPTFIVAKGPVESCAGFDCIAPAPTHDKISGNISVHEALKEMSEGGDGAADVARAALKRLDAKG